MRSPLMILPLAALLACGGGGSDATGPGTTGGSTNPGGNNPGGTGAVTTTAVDMKNLAYTPSAIKVASGATVTSTNQDGTDHSVIFDGGAATGTGTVSAGAAKASVMPTAAGTYTYHCGFHPTMTGTVQVQ
jgi:plastocyanin